MAKYFKGDRRAKFELPLWLVALETEIKPVDVMWKCRGSCYRSSMRDPPLSRHIKLEFLGGTVYLQCRECGAAVVSDSPNEQIIDTCPEQKRLSVIDEYKQLKKEELDALRKQIDNNKKTNKRGKKEKKQVNK